MPTINQLIRLAPDERGRRWKLPRRFARNLRVVVGHERLPSAFRREGEC
jgi:hypothetical protein